MRGEVFIINDTVCSAKDAPKVWEDVDDVLTLIDDDGHECKPNRCLFNPKYRILLTSSSRDRKDRKWLVNQVGHENAAFVMELINSSAHNL